MATPQKPKVPRELNNIVLVGTGPAWTPSRERRRSRRRLTPEEPPTSSKAVQKQTERLGSEGPPGESINAAGKHTEEFGSEGPVGASSNAVRTHTEELGSGGLEASTKGARKQSEELGSGDPLGGSSAAARVEEAEHDTPSSGSSTELSITVIPTESCDEMGPLKDNVKRKATDEPNSPSESKRIKNSNSESPEPEEANAPKPGTLIPFPEKPAVIEERNGEIEFRVVNNDNQRESLIILTGLKCIFQKQLPKMPKDYIARLVYDRTHLSMAIVKKPLEVVGGITYRPFKGRQFAEIVFCAISSDQQVKGYGAHLMSHLKDYVKATSDVMHFLTYADNYAIGYFKKQGFTKEITLEKPKWMGYIKDYEGGTIMQCTMLPRVRYLEMGRMLLKQKETVHAKIRAFSKSHQVHAPPKQWKNGICKIDPMSIDAIRASGWSADMDELARQPRHGPNHKQLMHLLNDMQNHQSSWPFLQPVSRDDVADYYDVIKEPMDLSTMEVKLEADNYTTPEDFVKDAKLVFDNCRKYNNETTPYAKSANKLEKYMWQQIKAVPEWSHLEP